MEAQRYKFERATNDLERCDGHTVTGPCPFKKVPGSKFCPRHGANATIREKDSENIRLYTAAKWAERIGAQANHPKAKSLAEEVGIMRIMISERLELCKDNADLVMASSSITQMLATCKELVTAWHKIEKERALYLDLDRARKLADDILGCITRYVNDTDVNQAIAEDIVGVFSKLNQ